MNRLFKILTQCVGLPIIAMALSPHVMADECTSMLPYLREIRDSASAASGSAAAASTYNAMLMDVAQRAESESGEVSIKALGYGSGGGESSKNKSDLDYHLAASQSDSSSASESSKWLRDYSNTIAESTSTMVGQCLNRRGLEYSFIVGGDGKTFYIRASFKTPTDQLREVTVRDVVNGDNISCDTDNFKIIDAGETTLKCTRKNLGGDTIVIDTNFTTGGDKANFFVPDIRSRFREKTVNLDLTWCGYPRCALDMSRQLAWNPKSTLDKLQPGKPLSCSFFDLRELGLLREGDILLRNQTFPLQLISTKKGNWGSIRQATTQSVPISNRTIKLCGTRDEPFEDWPNLYFNVRTQVKYFERIFN